MSRIATLTLMLLATGNAGAAERAIRFATDVVPILTRHGCNSGGCHGKATGQNGFKLSLLGFEPAADYHSLVQESRGRRISLAAPRQSLMLRKATNQIPHGGGQALPPASADYDRIEAWIRQGAAPPHPTDPVLQRIEVAPTRLLLNQDATEPLRVSAFYSDGTTEDVTPRALFLSNQPDVAAVSEDGVVRAAERRGLFSVMVRYGGQIATSHGTVPGRFATTEIARQRTQFAALRAQLQNPLDRHLLQQWERLRILPSEPTDDASFIRRVSLDICGTLPTAREVTEYVRDSRADKRARLIDRLLERPEYADYFALKWADILRNRGAGYSTKRQRAGTALFRGWIRDAVATNLPYDEFVTQILTATGSQEEHPPTVWYRNVRTPTDCVESVAQAFLGVRIQCAQCHHHPFERWSQADYFSLAAVFARVGRKGGFADAEVPTNEIIYLKSAAKVTHPRTGRVLVPRALGGPELPSDAAHDPRLSLARWLTAADNPFFARTMVNRLWAHFFRRGIIDPIDDARSTNPPSNPELLNELAETFVAARYDVKQMIRVICNSYAYGLSSTPNASNADDVQAFARFHPRRLSAEVLLDAISQVTDVPTEFPGGPGTFPRGTRAIELPDENVPSHFLTVFGRPARTSACECERVDAPALGQALELINSPEIHRKLMDKQGFAARLAQSGDSQEASIEAVFLRVLARRPRSEERQLAMEFLNATEDREEAYRSLLWSLLATHEFMFNH